jgi:hypothetical protein
MLIGGYLLLGVGQRETQRTSITPTPKERPTLPNDFWINSPVNVNTAGPESGPSAALVSDLS